MIGSLSRPGNRKMIQAFVFVGTMVSNDLVWELTDMFNYLMVLPNAIALFALTGIVVACAKKK